MFPSSQSGPQNRDTWKDLERMSLLLPLFKNSSTLSFMDRACRVLKDLATKPEASSNVDVSSFVIWEQIQSYIEGIQKNQPNPTDRNYALTSVDREWRFFTDFGDVQTIWYQMQDCTIFGMRTENVFKGVAIATKSISM
jgi:hypothetical protein